jgi:transcriptional regulator with XRE-family HTH domain
MYNTDNAFPAIEIAPEEEALYRIQRQVAGWVSHLLSEKKEDGWNQTVLANAMGKKQPYVNRILANGGANLTLKTVAELEAALGQPILLTPPEFEHRVIHDHAYAQRLSQKMREVRAEEETRLSGTSSSSSASNVEGYVHFIMPIYAQKAIA